MTPSGYGASRHLAAALMLLCIAGACDNDGDALDPVGPGAEATTTTTRPTPAAEDRSRVADPLLSLATGGHERAIGGMRFDVTSDGYTEREFFFEGVAATFAPETQSPAPYRSRMIVWTPNDPDRFNGTTVVEWAHVSDFGQFELTMELNYQAPMLLAEGYAFVLVSAEEGGICDATSTGCSGTSLIGADPARYGTLAHPGDAYSFDVFNQALQVIKHPTALAPLGELDAGTLIVEGFQPSIDKWFPLGSPDPESSMSPFSIYGPLNAYLANGADDAARLADAFLIDAAAPRDAPVHRVPTLYHLDESAIRREPDEDGTNHVTWEVVGAPHADRWGSDHVRLPSADGVPPFLTRDEEAARRARFENLGIAPDPSSIQCAPGPSTGSLFPRQFTVNAALDALRTWAVDGVPAPSAPRIERIGPEPDVASAKLERDGDGNALGGLRLPLIDVPVATYNGEECIQAGTTTPFTAERIAGLYPSHRGFVEALAAATDAAVEARHLRCDDAITILRVASASSVGGPDRAERSPACAARAPGAPERIRRAAA